MTIRPATLADSEGILALLVQVNNVHEANRPDLFIKDKTKYTAAELAEILADKTRPIFVAAGENGAVLGYAFCVFEPHKDNYNLRDFLTLYIDDICVDEACRGQHVATGLYEHVRQYAKAIGCYHITLNVWTCNPTAMKFYEAMGMQPLKTMMEEIV